MKKEELDNFCVVVDDIQKDRKKVVEKAMEIFEFSKQYYSPFDNQSFDFNYKRYKQLKEEITNSYKEASKPIFANKNWKQLIGADLRYSKVPRSEQIKEEIKK